MKTNKTLITITITFVFLVIFLFYFHFSSIIKNFQDVPTREGRTVMIQKDVVNKLNNLYLNNQNEFAFCLNGNNGENIVINDLIEIETIASNTNVIFKQDPPCQLPNSLGLIHSHPSNLKFKGTLCKPSFDDMFLWGEMKNPEPVIQIIQCGINKFYIFESPKGHEGVNLISLGYRILGSKK